MGGAGRSGDGLRKVRKDSVVGAGRSGDGLRMVSRVSLQGLRIWNGQKLNNISSITAIATGGFTILQKGVAARAAVTQFERDVSIELEKKFLHLV